MIWVIDNVENLCEIEYGTRVVRKREQGTIYPVYGGGGETFRIDRKNRTSRVVIARFGMSERCTRYVDGDFFLNDSGLTLSPKSDELSQDFLNKIIFSLNDSIYSIGRGTAQKNLNMDAFKKLIISYPPLAEQERIVAKLDTAFAKIDEAVNVDLDQEIEVQKLKVSLLSKVIDDQSTNLTPLGEVFDFKNGRSFKKTEWCESGLPIIRIQNLNDVNALFNYFEGDYDSAIEVNANDLLFSWSGTVGSSFGAHIWQREKGVLNQHIFKLKKKKEIDTRYAFYCLKNITKLIENSVVGAVGLVHITKKNLIEFEIPLPPLKEQKRIVIKLDAAYDKFKNINESIAKSKANFLALKSAILAKELQSSEAA